MGNVEVIKLFIELVYGFYLPLTQSRRLYFGLNALLLNDALGLGLGIGNYFLGLGLCLGEHIRRCALSTQHQLRYFFLGAAYLNELRAQKRVFVYELTHHRLYLFHLGIYLVGVIILLLCDLKAYAVKILFRNSHFCRLRNNTIFHYIDISRFAQKFQRNF